MGDRKMFPTKDELHVCGDSMLERSRFKIVSHENDRLIIRDLGPWDRFKTITNNAECVVGYLYEREIISPSQKLFYFDSDNRLDEILIEDGEFAGFRIAREESQ